MAETLMIRCPKCGATNRVPQARLVESIVAEFGCMKRVIADMHQHQLVSVGLPQGAAFTQAAGTDDIQTSST